MDAHTQPHVKATGRRLLRCDVCGRTDEVTASDLLRYSQDGWPRCCDQVMSYFKEAAPDDTATEFPALSPDRLPKDGGG